MRMPPNRIDVPIAPRPQPGEENGQREEKARRDAAEPGDHFPIVARSGYTGNRLPFEYRVLLPGNCLDVPGKLAMAPTGLSMGA